MRIHNLYQSGPVSVLNGQNKPLNTKIPTINDQDQATTTSIME